MEKLKLNNGTILELSPMKLDIIDKLFKVTVITELNYLELEEILLNIDNISKIQHLSESDEILTTYSDCVGFKTMSRDYENNTYVIELDTDVTLATLKASQDKINLLEVDIFALKNENLELKELVDALIVSALEV